MNYSGLFWLKVLLLIISTIIAITNLSGGSPIGTSRRVVPLAWAIILTNLAILI